MRNNYDERKLIIVSTYFFILLSVFEKQHASESSQTCNENSGWNLLLPVSGEGLLYVTYGTVPDVKVVVVVTVVVVG